MSEMTMLKISKSRSQSVPNVSIKQKKRDLLPVGETLTLAGFAHFGHQPTKAVFFIDRTDAVEHQMR